MSTYAWIIDTVNTKDLGDDCADEKGICGPSDAPAELLDKLQRTRAFGHVFRLVDGDGIWYYRGRIAFADGDAPAARQVTLNPGDAPMWVVCGGLSGDEVADFGPLYDFGTPNAGAVDIQYRVRQTDEDGASQAIWASL